MAPKETDAEGVVADAGPARWARHLEALRAHGLSRRLEPQTTPALPEVERGGRRLVNLASNNYLGLASDPRVLEAAREALSTWGVGAGASRLVTGDMGIHHALEEALASFKGAEAALVFASGYAANMGVLSALAGPKDLILADALDHASLIDGCRVSRALVRRYRHGDMNHLEDLLKNEAAEGERLIVTDAIFSMDGDLAPIPALVELADRFGATLVVDDAHGTGVLGAEGRGTVHHFGLSGRVPVEVGTLSKALGVQGGFVAGSRALVDLVSHKARAFVYSTGIAPVLAGAALASLGIARAEGWRRTTQQEHLRRLRRGLSAAGFDLVGEDGTPLSAVLLGEPGEAVRISKRLESGGVLAPAIRPPTVPAGTSRIRIAPMATQSAEQIDRALAAFQGAAPGSD